MSPLPDQGGQCYTDNPIRVLTCMARLHDIKYNMSVEFKSFLNSFPKVPRADVQHGFKFMIDPQRLQDAPLGRAPGADGGAAAAAEVEVAACWGTA